MSWLKQKTIISHKFWYVYDIFDRVAVLIFIFPKAQRPVFDFHEQWTQKFSSEPMVMVKYHILNVSTLKEAVQK